MHADLRGEQRQVLEPVLARGPGRAAVCVELRRINQNSIGG
jgi:hypothetical protein